jgi:hypothetical protein
LGKHGRIINFQPSQLNVVSGYEHFTEYISEVCGRSRGSCLPHRGLRRTNLTSDYLSPYLKDRLDTMSQTIDHNKRHYVEDDIQTILNVRIFIEPDRVDEWIEKSKELFQTVMAEPACRYFITGQVEGKPGELWWTEGWSESKEWLMQVSCVASLYHNIAAGADANMHS